MSTANVPLREMRGELTKWTPRMIEVVGARGADEYVQRQVGLTMLTIKDNAALQRCSVESIATALIRICGWRLEVGRTAYLLPFKGSCTASPAWQGLVELMVRARHVRDVYPVVVYEHDHFRRIEGTEKRLEHEPANIKDRGDIVGFYAVAQLPYGRSTFEFMWKEEVDKVRAAAPMPNSDLWTKHYAEGGKKTVIRRIAKRMPQGDAVLASAVAADESGELAQMASMALDVPSASMLRGAGGAPMYLPHERHALPVGDRAQHPMAVLPAGDPYGAPVPDDATLSAATVPARTSAARGSVPTSPGGVGGPRIPFEGMQDYDPRDLHPERYGPDGALLPEFADAPALALGDVTRARKRDALAEG